MILDERFFDRFGVEFGAGHIIFCEYEPGNEFYFIQTGRVKIVKIINNMEKTISILEPGDVFGEMAILEEQPRSATAISVDNVRLLKFHRDNFDTLLQGNPQMAYKLLVIFSKRIYDARRRLKILLLDENQHKVMDVLNMLAENDPSLDLDNQASLQVNAAGIASWSGLDEAEVQKQLTHLAHLNKLELHGDRIVVRSIRDFQRVVDTRRKNMYS